MYHAPLDQDEKVANLKLSASILTAEVFVNMSYRLMDMAMRR